jgi:hypothetical protein
MRPTGIDCATFWLQIRVSGKAKVFYNILQRSCRRLLLPPVKTQLMLERAYVLQFSRYFSTYRPRIARVCTLAVSIYVFIHE